MNRHDRRTGDALRARRFVISGFLLLAAYAFCAGKVQGQTLRTNLSYVDEYGRSDYVVLLAWIGLPDDGPSDARRVFVWTTSSASPNATAPAPWDQVGENPYAMFRVSEIPATQRVQDEATGAWREEPIPGWLAIPVRKGQIFLPSENRWIEDRHLRVLVNVSDSPGCPVVACGARPLLARTDLFLVPRSPGVERRRAVS